MCRSCHKTTGYIRISDDIVAQVVVDNYDYDDCRVYTDEELKETIELEVKTLYMSREAFIKHINEVTV